MKTTPIPRFWAIVALSPKIGNTRSWVRLLRRSAHAEDRPAVFAAQFALSHACWLVTYPVAGWAGEAFGLPVAMALLGAIAVLGAALAARLWPEGDAEELAHAHPDLPADHPHLAGAHDGHNSREHTHRFVIDDLHPGRRSRARSA